jgi:hypothetical protein
MPKAETTLDDQIPLLVSRVDLCLEILHGIVSGVKEAHSAGIIHRDLKPTNVLFQDKALRDPLISDFGICFVKGTADEDRVTELHETVGAKFYMAPEQEQGGRTDVGETADMYALGKLLHSMLTGRTLYREDLGAAFTQAEIEADPRLSLIREEILARTIVLQPGKRVQTASELLEIVDKVRQRLGGPAQRLSFGSQSANGEKLKSPVPGARPSEGIAEAFGSAIAALDEGRLRSVRLSFDHALTDFSGAWVRIRKSITSPTQAQQAAQDLIMSQRHATGLTLAMGRMNATELFPDFKRLLESITRSTESEPGYLAINAVPHVLAGFLYMTASVAALHFESWDVLKLLLRTQFEWFYRSERPLYSFGFDHAYFFHAEALGRKASASHDLFRAELSRVEILGILGLNKEGLLNVYLQTQLVMSLRAAQEKEVGKDVGMFADFGRFYDWRIIPLLDRLHSDPEADEFFNKVFSETRDEWFSRLNDRLKIVQSEFWGQTDYIWESISSYEPRE